MQKEVQRKEKQAGVSGQKAGGIHTNEDQEKKKKKT